jgi:hypothetical protein
MEHVKNTLSALANTYFDETSIMSRSDAPNVPAIVSLTKSILSESCQIEMNLMKSRPRQSDNTTKKKPVITFYTFIIERSVGIKLRYSCIS